MIVVYTILLIFCLIFQIFIGVELRLNLEDYIEVHNHMKKSGFGFLGMFISNLSIKKIFTYKINRKLGSPPPASKAGAPLPLLG